MRPYFTAALLALPSALHAEPMTLDSALSRAASEAPELQSREAGVDAAQSAAIAADRLPDPKLNIVLQDFPVTGPDAGRFNRDDFTMQVIGVSQDFPNPAKRRARATRAQVFAVVDAAFAHRRKALRPSLRDLAGSAEAAEAALVEAGVDPMTRGEALGIEEFVRIAEALA